VAIPTHACENRCKEKYSKEQIVRRICIYGANERGELILAELYRGRHSNFQMLGFVDNLPSDIQRIHKGYNVYAVADIPYAGEAIEILFFTGDLTEDVTANLRARGYRCCEVKLLLD